jgi:hypothetical protein
MLTALGVAQNREKVHDSDVESLERENPAKLLPLYAAFVA